MGSNRISEGHKQPTRHERLRDVVNNLEERIDKGGFLSSFACSQVPDSLELLIENAPEDVKNTAKRIRTKCKYKGPVAFLLINFRTLFIVCILAGGIFIAFSYFGSGTSPQNSSESMK